VSDTHRQPPLFEFPCGLPAFEDERSFVLVERPDFSPLVLLQSSARPGLRFVCVPASVLVPDYRFELGEEESALLGEGRHDCLAILTFPRSGEPTANLMAPIVLSRESMRGVQSIQSVSGYSHCHPLREEGTCL